MASAEQYLRLLQNLTPRGRAWNRTEGSTLTEFLQGTADEFARVDARSVVLQSERDTRTATVAELLGDIETELGLPDDWASLGATEALRQTDANNKLTLYGRLQPQFFIDFAATLGWTITIDEFTPFWMGVGVMGDPVGDQQNLFYWQVNTDVASTADEDDLDLLFIFLNKYKPAHTIVQHAWSGVAFDYAFSSAFDAFPVTTAWLQGAFAQAFDVSFDTRFGGAFSTDEFSFEFNRPQARNFVVGGAFDLQQFGDGYIKPS